MERSVSKLLGCYREQCSHASKQPCWLRNGPSLARGVNLHGFLRSETGLGESARLLYEALASQNIGVAACNRDLDVRDNSSELSDVIADDACYNASINVDGLLGFKGLRHLICSSKTNIAYPFWELDVISPKFVGYLKRFDDVWAPSSFIFDVLQSNGIDNASLIKQPIYLPEAPRTGFGSGSTLSILFHFDFDSFPARKNPEAAVHAFKLAFGASKDVSLTIKARGSRDVGRRSWLAQAVQGDDRIQVIDRLLTRKEVSTLVDTHDVFISMHRSEGFGLGCAEALAAGKAVVATDFGGSTDFITDETGFPVQWTRIDVGPDEYPMADGATWAEPSIEHAAEQLRFIFDNPQLVQNRTQLGWDLLVREHSTANVGQKMRRALRNL